MFRHCVRSRLFPVLLAVAACAPPLAAAAPDIKEGRWEYEVKMDMPGMPMKMPPMKTSQCVTRKDLVPKSMQNQPECKNVTHKISGDTVTWTGQCKQGDMTMETSGSVTYKANSMQGTIKNTMIQPGQPGLTSVSHITGKHVGPCQSQK